VSFWHAEPVETRHPRLVLAAAILGSGVAFLDGSVVNVALPAIRQDLGGGLASQQWVVEAYLLTMSSLLLLAGGLTDRFGRRRVYAIGLMAFAVTSLLCATAPSDEALVAARAMQGAAAALLVPGALALLTASFAGEERGRAIGSWTAWTGVAFIMGPLAGGFLVDIASWRLAFVINVPVVAVALLILARFVPESADPDAARRVDLLGSVLGVAGLGGLVFGLIEKGGRSFADPLVALPLGLGAFALAAFVAWERRAAHPMLPPGLFRSRNFTVTNLATLAVYGGLGAATFFAVVFLQQVVGYGALEAGLALLPVTVMMLALSRPFGKLSARLGPRLPMALGPAVAAAGLSWLSFAGSTPAYVSDLAPALTLFGLGLAITVAPLTTTVLSAVEQRRAGIASGVNNAVARVAGLVAIAGVGLVVSSQFGSSLDRRLAEQPISPSESSAVTKAKNLALTGGGGDVASPRIALAIRESSAAAFHVGIGVSAALMLAGGLIAGVGIRNSAALAQMRAP